MGTVALNRVCVRYPNNDNAVPQLTLLEPNRCAADLFGFSEFRKSYTFMQHIPVRRDSDDIGACRWHRFGLGMRYSVGNLGHQGYYAAAMHKALVDFASASSSATFVPIGAGSPAHRPDHMWEYTLRSLSRTPLAQMLAELKQTLQSCTCFEQLVIATQGVNIFSELSRAALWSFRRSSVSNLQAMGLASPLTQRAPQDMLFIVRRARARVITNEEEAVGRVLAAHSRVRALAFEQVPMARQMELVSSASVLIGVHGQAVAAFAFFLPTELRRTAIVEIIPKRDSLSQAWLPIIRGVARGAGVRHYRMESAHGPGCMIDYLRHLNCSAPNRMDRHGLMDQRDPRVCKKDRAKAMKHFQAVNVLNCNVTVEVKELLQLIGEADNYTRPDQAYKCTRIPPASRERDSAPLYWDPQCAAGLQL